MWDGKPEDRYVDDILIIYDQNKTNIDHTLNEFKKSQSTINFTIEKEEHESVNFLDIVIHRNGKNFEFAIYRKPTQTDILIPNSSCHSYEHKLSSINYLVNRLYTYPITEKAKVAEMNTIQNVLRNNDYDINLISNPPQKKTKLKCTYQRAATNNKVDYLYIQRQGNESNLKAFS
jgi:hypothetical protein